MLPVSITVPEVAVTVTLAMPSSAEPLASIVTTTADVLVTVTGLELKAAVTPLGKPEAESITLPVNPLLGVMVTVLVVLFC